jgi:ankyrin repeat protein
MLKFWDDEVLLAKISQRLGSAGAPSGTAGPPPAAAPAPPEEVTNLFEAARWGDLEAVEDFIAVGKDVNAADKEGRRPLHVAVAYGRDEPGMQIVQALLEAGAQLEAVDVKMNTALHYAAGYGRAEYARMLLDAGADASRRNETGKSALELVRLSPKNPVREDAELMARLEKADSAVFFRDS